MAVVYSISNARPDLEITHLTHLGAPPPSTPSKAGVKRGIFGRNAKSTATVIPAVQPSNAQKERASMGDYHEGNVVMYSIFRNSIDHQAVADPAPPMISAHAPPQSVARTASRAAMSRKTTDRFSSMGRWNPPPLFEAYPQAIKHAYLQTPIAPAEELIRRHHYERYARLRQEMLTKTDKTPQEQEPVVNTECHNKIFVLVQGGYLLQYAGKGSYNRLPEKILPLGKNSVAFASDAIPGKPWVLQVSQRSNGAETGAMDNATSVFLRLSLRGSSARKVVGSLLLVLYSAAEMESWISIVRAQIESMGGRPLSIDAREQDRIGLPSPSASLSLSRATSASQTSHRSASQRSRSDRGDAVVPTTRFDYSSSTLGDRLSPSRRSFDAPSESPSAASDDQIQLDRLRDGSRLSHSSSSATSHSPSSPITDLASSPAKEGFYRPQALTSPARAPIQLREPVAPIRRASRRDLAHSRNASEPRPSRAADPPFVVIPPRQRSNSSRAPPPPQVDEPHPGRRMSIVPSSPVAHSPTSDQSADPSWSPTEWCPPDYFPVPSSSSDSYNALEVEDASDPTAAISHSIMQLLSASIGEHGTAVSSTNNNNSARPRRSSSTRKRPRRPSNRSMSSPSSRAGPGSPGTGPGFGLASEHPCIPRSYYPEPLRINKRASLFVGAAGPPPVPPPVCPLPAVPLEPTPTNAITMESRLSELRKQSWKVTRAYHPLRIDVL